MLKCRTYRSRMTAYLHGELPPYLRGRLARHLDECPACYAYYVRERDLARELKRTLPLVGQSRPGQLSRIWAAVEADMTRPTQPRQRFHARYSLVALLLMLVFLMPWVFGKEEVALALPLPPAPEDVASATRTPPANGAAVALAAGATLSQTNDNALTPPAQPTLIPVPDATRTP